FSDDFLCAFFIDFCYFLLFSHIADGLGVPFNIASDLLKKPIKIVQKPKKRKIHDLTSARYENKRKSQKSMENS
uniref:Uncharacterized protein n=1 Tax=Romanomermis culicivorax TaxID=13658 RepID=A0A915LD15_ROMCU